MWWVLGIEQFLVPVYIIGLFILSAVYVAVRRPRVSIPPVVLWAVLLVVWWVVPLLWVERLDTFIKTFASAMAQAAFLLLFWNTIRTRQAWERVASGLSWMAGLVAVTVWLYTLGIWRGELTTAFGMALPGLADGSVFFSDLAVRSWGHTEGTLHPLLAFRLTSVATRSTSLSAVVIILLTFTIAYPLRRRWLNLVVLSGLLVGGIMTQVRMAYLAGVLAVGLYVLWRYGLFRERQRPLLFALLYSGSAVMLLLSIVFWQDIQATFMSSFVDAREGSWYNRQRIYQTSFELLPQHPIAGWGESVRIPGHSNSFSAGTHSDYLEMLFQRGVVGLGLYLALWGSIWWRWWQGVRMGLTSTLLHRFLVMSGIGLAVFNVHMLFSDWQWDQTAAIVVWTLWGLVITAPRCLQATETDKGSFPRER